MFKVAGKKILLIQLNNNDKIALGLEKYTVSHKVCKRDMANINVIVHQI